MFNKDFMFGSVPCCVPLVGIWLLSSKRPLMRLKWGCVEEKTLYSETEASVDNLRLVKPDLVWGGAGWGQA